MLVAAPARWGVAITPLYNENRGMSVVREVSIRDETIRLGQFLKLANLIDHGSEARPLMIQGSVEVNGEVETRRGRQLVPGDVVSLGGVSARVATGEVADDLPW